MRNSDMGTLAWAEVTKGKLRSADKIKQLVQMVGMQVDAWMVRRRPEILNLDWDELAPPDSNEAKQAAEHCFEVLTPALANHSMRGWLWGVMIAKHESMRFDPEVLFVSAMLHDLALSKRHEFCKADHPHNVQCFAVEGAFLGLDIMTPWNWPEEKKYKTAEAVSLHLNGDVPADKFGAEAYLLHEAAFLDVAGVKVDRIHPEDRRQVYERSPRLNMLREMGRLVVSQKARRPHSRPAFMEGLGFSKRLATAHSNELELQPVDQDKAVL